MVKKVGSTKLSRKLMKVRASGKMMAIIGYVLNEKWTDPYLLSMAVTSDGGVVVVPSYGHDEFIGSSEDLRRNLGGFASTAGLTREEMFEFNRLYVNRVDDWESRLGLI